jgi:hypothetical protein
MSNTYSRSYTHQSKHTNKNHPENRYERLRECRHTQTLVHEDAGRNAGGQTSYTTTTAAAAFTHLGPVDKGEVHLGCVGAIVNVRVDLQFRIGLTVARCLDLAQHLPRRNGPAVKGWRRQEMQCDVHAERDDEERKEYRCCGMSILQYCFVFSPSRREQIRKYAK